jgi:hypothetical protein
LPLEIGREVARERVQKVFLVGIAGQIAQRRYPYGYAGQQTRPWHCRALGFWHLERLAISPWR